MSSTRKLRRTLARRRDVSPSREADGFEIVYGPLLRHPWQTPEMNQRIRRLHHLANTAPAEAVPELLATIERHPEVPIFYNYLAAAYLSLGDDGRAEEVIEENYRRNPDYLFARVNHAEICIRDGDLEGAAEALGGAFDLRALYPDRRQFHVSEVVAFTYAVGLYHLETGDWEAADVCHVLLHRIAPEDRTTDAFCRIMHPIRLPVEIGTTPRRAGRRRRI
jgi:tetratricopeptide (TPR) repeat protein